MRIARIGTVIAALLAACSSANVTVGGLAYRSAPPASWAQIGRLDGSFVSHLPENSGLTCGRGAECRPVVSLPFQAFAGPIRARCFGEFQELVVNLSSASEEGSPGNLPAPAGFRCRPWSSGERRSHVQLVWETQELELGLAAIHQRDGSLLGYGESADYTILIEAWKGPWREPVCGREGSALPDGRWGSCITKDSVADRWTSADPEF